MHPKKVLPGVILCLGIGLSLILISFITVQASQKVSPTTIINVNVFTDDLTVNGNCTLREAIQAANTDAGVDACSAGNGDDIIQLGYGTYFISRAGSGENGNVNGDFDIITDSLTIRGLGPNNSIIDANKLDRIFDLQSQTTQATIIISGVRIINGRVNIGTGGGINNPWSTNLSLINSTVISNITSGNSYGGGIYQAGGDLIINNSWFYKNKAGLSGGGLYAYFTKVLITDTLVNYNQADGVAAEHGGGGAYFRNSGVSLNGVRILNNATGNNGAGLYLNDADLNQTGIFSVTYNVATQNGGGIFLDDGSTMELSEARILYNSAFIGGGIYINGGDMVLNDTRFMNNDAIACGGALCNFWGTSELDRAQIIDNSADTGGGICNYDSMTVDQSVIADNQAINSGDAGGIMNRGRITITNSTISSNFAGDDGGGLVTEDGTTVITYTTIASNTAGSEGGGLFGYNALGAIKNSLLAYNLPNNCADDNLDSNGHNLEDSNDCNLTAVGDITGTDPFLGELIEDSNTLVHPLLKNSQAIDHGICIAALNTDQRGEMRPLGPGCDIGSYEAWRWWILLPVVLK